LRVLQDISLDVPEGAIVALLGGNASGKTSTLRAIAGLSPVFSGCIAYQNREITELATHERVKLGIAFCGAERQLFPEMSVRENLEMGSFAQQRKPLAPRFSLENFFKIFPNLTTKLEERASSLSGGEQKMIAIGRSLLAQPRLLLLDEPSLGLAPQMVEELGRALLKLNAHGLTLLMAEQNLPLAMGLAHRVYVLERGRIVEEENLKEFSV
jgi:branched-chain amino acid transport system ATP-binding protein